MTKAKRILLRMDTVYINYRNKPLQRIAYGFVVILWFENWKREKQSIAHKVNDNP